MSNNLPQPTTTEHELLVAVCRRLDAQNALLGEIRDRLPGQAHAESPPTTDPSGPVAVDLREPEPASRTGAKPAQTDPDPEPARTSRAARTGRRSTKGSN